MKSVWRAAIPLVMALGLAGCSAPSGSTAYLVNGKAVSEKQIDIASAGCAKLTNQTVAEVRASMMNSVLAGSLGDAIAAKTNTAVTDDERKTLLDASQQGRLMQEDPDCNNVAQGLATFLIVLEKVGEEPFGQHVAELDVKVNPRYGTWDPAQGAAIGSGSLSERDTTRP